MSHFVGAWFRSSMFEELTAPISFRRSRGWMDHGALLLLSGTQSADDDLRRYRPSCEYAVTTQLQYKVNDESALLHHKQ